MPPVKSTSLSMREYNLIADWYLADRSRTFGVAEALDVAATLSDHARIPDLGCGNGMPITTALVDAGHRVVGLDSSEGMLARLRLNLPNTPIVRGDARRCPFVDGSFDAAISWGMIFHPPPDDQAAVFAGVSRVLRPGAPFLFAATEMEGAGNNAIEGMMSGVTFHYCAVPHYQTLIDGHGLVLENILDDPGVSTYYLARKSQ